MRNLIDLIESFMSGNNMFWVSPDGEIHTDFNDHGEYAYEILGYDISDWMRAEDIYSGNIDDDDSEWFDDFCLNNNIGNESPREIAIVNALKKGWVRAEIEMKGILDLESYKLKDAWDAAQILVNDEIHTIELSGIVGGDVPSVTLREPELSRFVKTGRIVGSGR